MISASSQASPLLPPTLVASDVDGTLIDDANRITPRTHAAVAAVKAAGAEFVIATGRPPRWIAEITDQFHPAPGDGPFVRYAVCANGAILYDVVDDRVLSASTLPVEVLIRLGEAAYEVLPGCGIAAERVGESANDAATPPFVATSGYEHAWLNPDHIEVGDDEVFRAPAVKLLLRQPDMTSDAMAQRLIPVVGELAEITYSTDNGLIELSVPETHKASGLQRLIAEAGLTAQRTAAFGDMPNDVEMLRWADLGVAMGNGHPAAVAAADEVTTDNSEDGVARVLERWFPVSA